MAKVIAIMSTSLDGYVADRDDGVVEVFDWYMAGDVDVPTPSPEWTFRVSAPSAAHLRGLMGEVGAMFTGRRTFDKADGWDGQHPWGIPAFVLTHEVPMRYTLISSRCCSDRGSRCSARPATRRWSSGIRPWSPARASRTCATPYTTTQGPDRTEGCLLWSSQHGVSSSSPERRAPASRPL